MKHFIVIVTIVLGLAFGQSYEKDAEVRNFKNVVNDDGTYEYQFDTTNGIAIQESGLGGQYASGYSQHYAPDGTLVQLTYTADENGFHPYGDHLPTPPPVPEYIARAIEYIRTHPSREEPGSSKF